MLRQIEISSVKVCPAMLLASGVAPFQRTSSRNRYCRVQVLLLLGTAEQNPPVKAANIFCGLTTRCPSMYGTLYVTGLICGQASQILRRMTCLFGGSSSDALLPRYAGLIIQCQESVLTSCRTCVTTRGLTGSPVASVNVHWAWLMYLKCVRNYPQLIGYSMCARFKRYRYEAQGPTPRCLSSRATGLEAQQRGRPWRYCPAFVLNRRQSCRK